MRFLVLAGALVMSADLDAQQAPRNVPRPLPTMAGKSTVYAPNGIAATSEPSPEGKANLDKLKPLKGAEFDKAFKAAMIEDHQKDIAKYEKQAASGDAQTAALAKETLPTLRKHLATAKSL